ARRVGRDRTFITNYLRVLKLPTDIQTLLERDKLTFGHARALLGVQDPATQRRLAQKIVKHNWSVRETERRVRQLASEAERQPSKAVTKQIDPNVRAAEVKLRRALSTQVRILQSRSGVPGKVDIEFYDLADLDRIFNLIVRDSGAHVAYGRAQS